MSINGLMVTVETHNAVRISLDCSDQDKDERVTLHVIAMGVHLKNTVPCLLLFSCLPNEWICRVPVFFRLVRYSVLFFHSYFSKANSLAFKP